jgi:cytoskeletal protein RodZ
MSKDENSGSGQQIHQETAATVGERLRQLRREKGLSIRDIVLETNISAANLTAIEEDDYQELPADTFMRGQVAIYAKLLGLDGSETAKAFLRQRDAQTGDKKKNRFNGARAANRLAEPAHLSSASLAGLLLLLVILAVAGFSFHTDWNPFAYIMNRGQQQPPAPALVMPEASSPSPSTEAVSPAAPQPDEQPQAGPAEQEAAAVTSAPAAAEPAATAAEN